MKAFVRDNSLSLFFGALFLGSLGLQAWAGWHVFNHDATAHGSPTVGFGRYLVSSHYGQAVLENWQSEYLQFFLFVVATMWLFQKGSPESKPEPGPSSDEEERLGRYSSPRSPRWARAGGWRTRLYSYSLPLLMVAIFLWSWAGHSVTGWNEFNDERRDHDEPPVAWPAYLGTAEFWEDTLQNWQSEFLAVGSFAVFAIYLRARGSSESKPVGAPHDETGA